jgi:IS4 transposase
MDEFAGAFGDRRRAAAMQRTFGSMVEQSSVVVRKVGVNRRGELSAHRVLSSEHVTPGETLDCFARHTAKAVAGRRIVAAQDTTEVNFPGRQSRGLGPAGRQAKTPGFFIHATVAVDADEDTVLGLVDAQIWTRADESATDRRQRDFEDKESHRWLRSTNATAERMPDAAECVSVSDRESDIYALFGRRPRRVQLLVRAAQDRTLADNTRLFAAAHAWPALGEQVVKVPPRGPGDRGREARVSLRAGRVLLRHPRHARRRGDPAVIAVTLVEAVEMAPPEGGTPLHWRLLTTLPAETEAEAAEVVRLYRLRWRIEQIFRMLKSDGLRLQEAQTAAPHRLFNLAALAIGAAVRIIQLVDARDGSSRPATDVASEAQIAAAKALCPTLEGKTDRQRNPHPPGSLAWMSWVVARLGGWNCYYKPPGPKTMRDGWQRFAAIAEGFALAYPSTHDVRIP